MINMNIVPGVESDWIDFENFTGAEEDFEYYVTDEEECEVEELVEYYEKKYGGLRFAK